MRKYLLIVYIGMMVCSGWGDCGQGDTGYWGLDGGGWMLDTG
jgi:hypothetical protein